MESELQWDRMGQKDTFEWEWEGYIKLPCTFAIPFSALFTLCRPGQFGIHIMLLFNFVFPVLLHW